MDIFLLTRDQMLTMLVFIVVGFILRKVNILPENARLTISRLETHIFVPALNLYNWMNNCTLAVLKENAVLIVYGMVIVFICVLLAYPLSGLFVRKADDKESAYQRKLYRYAMAFGNYGFMGNYIVLGVWGEEMFFRYSMFTLIVCFVCNCWGPFTLIPGDQKDGKVFAATLKRIVNPPIIGLFLGLLAGLLNVKAYLPTFAMNALSNASKCMGPVAMVLAGVVIGGFDMKKLLSVKKVYLATFMRLVLIPVMIIEVLKLLGVSNEIVTLAFIAFGTPIGLNTILYPSAYDRDVKTGASMTVISHVLSVVTIPMLYLLFLSR